MSELEPELPADPVAEAPETPAAPEPVAPEPQYTPVDWDNPQHLSEAAARLQALGYTIGQAQPEPQPENVLPEYDPYNPQQYLDAFRQQIVDEVRGEFAPVKDFFQTEQDQRVESQITGQIDTIKGQLGYDGDSKELRALADMFAPEQVARFGQTPAAGQAAIRAAIDHAKARDEATGQRAVEAYKESLKNPNDSTPYEPGVRGIGRVDESAFTSEADVARSWRDRQPI